MDGFTFYTLYGHLSVTSIRDLEVGQRVKQHSVIGQLGTAEVNGDYPPHLHFQVIFDIENEQGDYPGVCSLNKRAIYKNNCPDGAALLGLV